MKKFFGAALGALAALSLAACNGTGGGSTYDPSFDVPESFNVFTPITLPSLFTKAPPLLPALIAASV